MMIVGYIDTHAHLYDKSFQDDIQEVIDRALASGVNRVLMPNCDVHTLNEMLALEASNPTFFKSMLGLHPTYVKEDYKEQLDQLHAQLDEKSFCAIGEIGLDYYWDKTFISEQKDAFEQQIKWAKSYELPIVIHTRNSIPDGIKIVKAQQDGKLEGVFHCFSGSLEEAKKIVELGFLLGIGGISTFKNGGLTEILKEIPLSALVLETDAPYLAPTPFRGKRNESAYIPFIAEEVAKVKEISVDEVAMTTTQNAYELFKLNEI